MSGQVIMVSFAEAKTLDEMQTIINAALSANPTYCFHGFGTSEMPFLCAVLSLAPTP